jgi:hypothetical protein
MYEPNKYYLVDNKRMKMVKFVKCEISNGEEICSTCRGRILFICDDISIEKCGWKYIKFDNYQQAYSEFVDDL